MKENPPTSPGIHILVIDDEQPIRDVLKALLTRNGFQVGTAAGSAEALAFLNDDPPDLVLSDIDIGGDDGLTLLTEIKRRHPALPVIMLTGMGYDEELMTEARTAKADGFVSKLIPSGQLMGEIRRVLRNAPARASMEGRSESPGNAQQP